MFSFYEGSTKLSLMVQKYISNMCPMVNLLPFYKLDLYSAASLQLLVCFEYVLWLIFKVIVKKKKKKGIQLISYAEGTRLVN